MPEELRRAAVVVATNKSRSRFYVQQKDAKYRPRPWGYSLFGGAVEPGEEPADTLKRELSEELGPAAARLLGAGPRQILSLELPAQSHVTLFEVMLVDDELETLASAPVFEGARGLLVSRAELLTLPFVWALDQLLRQYLESTSVAAITSGG